LRSRPEPVLARSSCGPVHRQSRHPFQLEPHGLGKVVHRLNSLDDISGERPLSQRQSGVQQDGDDLPKQHVPQKRFLRTSWLLASLVQRDGLSWGILPIDCQMRGLHLDPRIDAALHANPESEQPDRNDHRRIMKDTRQRKQETGRRCAFRFAIHVNAS